MSTESRPRARSLGILTAVLTAVGLVFGGLAIAQPAAADSAPPDPTNPSTPVTVTDDVLPTPQINGVVWAQVVVGNTVYVAGKFTSARPYGSPAGTNETPRNNLLAYDITTGTLLPFAPNLNAQALGITASPDGSRIYVVGDFTSIDSKGYYRLAAFSTATNTIISSFKPIMESETRAVAASNTTVYAGGDASTINGVARAYVGAVSAADGSTLNWQANADAPVDALALTKDGSKLIVGGRFQNLGGVANYGLGAVDAGPPQPGLLDDVLGVGGGAEHLVGDGEEQVAVGDERVVGHAAAGRGSGFRSQAAEKPWDVTPSAMLERAYMFASATYAVSSTSAGAPSRSSSRADNSSVTVSGVCDIASAYSMTSRSSGVKTSDSRHRGTSRALLSSSPSLWAMK